MEASRDLFLDKVKAVAAGPHGDLLRHLVDILYQQAQEFDDEPLTPEDLAAIKQGEEDIKAGRFILWDDLKKELDL